MSEYHYRDLAESTWAEVEDAKDDAARRELSSEALYYAQMATYYATAEMQSKLDNLEVHLSSMSSKMDDDA